MTRDRAVPDLAIERERRLVLAAQSYDGSAREELVELFQPHVASVARVYRGSRAVDRGELMQAGVVGVLRAADRYDPAVGTRFWAYASWWVRQAMQQLVAELARPVVLSDRALRQLARVKDARRTLLQDQRREPTVSELALRAGLRREHVEHLIAAERRPRGLEEQIGDGESAATFGDMLVDPRAEDAYDRVPPRVETRELSCLLRDLSDRERAIVRARYGLDGPERTLRDLAGGLGVSPERVRQIEQGALDKLRAGLTGHVEVLPPAASAP
jgi:RNA polymerase sigma factor (sigma-70 family)